MKYLRRGVRPPIPVCGHVYAFPKQSWLFFIMYYMYIRYILTQCYNYYL